MSRPLCFIDTETTSLRDDREVWEVAIIRREVDGTETGWHSLAPVTLRNADATALAVGGFHERHPAGAFGNYGSGLERLGTVSRVWRLTHGATLVGAQPHFDAHGLARLLPGPPAWHHRMVDIESLVAGYYGRQIGGLSDCMTALGLDWPAPGPHTALGDARAVRAIYDHLMGTQR